jgi:filamentous hemagglutinin family protein
VGGSATYTPSGGMLTINQFSQSLITNWNTFNIGSSAIVNFAQPNASAIALNRVTGHTNPSQIMGTLNANGIVFLVNPNGVIFGRGSTVNAAGFLATTHDIKNSDFMARKYNFTIPGNPTASIVNFGNITATSGGFAALVAPGVRNDGVITAQLGTVGLASSGQGFTLDMYGDKLITFAVNDQVASQVMDVSTGVPLSSLIANNGTLSANGGKVQITAAAAKYMVDSVINNTGVIEANAVGQRGGTIVLAAATGKSKPSGAPAQNVRLAGTISAAGKKAGQTGGTISVTGENISMTGAKIDASGQAGGGAVNIGGKNTAATATNVATDQTTTIDASAIQNGNGGNVVVWSDQLTTVGGLINARGSALGGNGGFVETSGGAVNFAGIRVDTSATLGKAGMWLVNPTNLTVDAAAAATIVSNLATTNVTLQTNADGSTSGPGTQSSGAGDIIVNASISWANNNTLTLDAFHDINLNSAVSTANGGLMLNAGNAITATAAVNVGTFTLQGGTWTQVASNLPAFSANDFRINGGTFIRALGGDGTEAPYQITDVYGLQGIGSAGMLGNRYVLANNIDANGTANWNGGAGFVPIGSFGGGSYGGGFNGTFDGLGRTISNLTINASGTTTVGLFGVIGSSNWGCSGGACSAGSVGNVNLVNASVTANGASAVGALVGINYGSIWQSSASGSVGRTGEGSGAVGGLAGENFGNVSTSSSGAAVTGGSLASVGGLAGHNGGTITRSYSTGVVSGGGGAFVGGLVGLNDSPGSITSSNATGTVSGGNAGVLGGLVGMNLGSIDPSYATGTVSTNGTGVLGGLVGINVGSINQSAATGAVTGGPGSIVGGLVGINTTLADPSSGTINQSYAAGAVTGGVNSTVGGLVGQNGGSIMQAYAVGRVTAGSGGVGAGLVAQDTVTAPAPPGYVFNSGPGTVSNSYYDTQTTGQQNSAGGIGLTTAQLVNGLPSGFTTPYFVPGSDYPTLPGLPAIPVLVPGPAGGGPTPRTNPGPAGNFGTQQIANFIPPPSNTNTNSLNFTPINLGGPTGSSGITSGTGDTGGNGGTTGSLANGRQGGNGAPLGTRLIDMPIIPLPPGSGMPPPGETRFSTNHVVFQIGNGVSPQQVAEIAAQFGLTVESSQTIDTLGRTIYTFNTNGKPVRDLIHDFESRGVGGFMQPEYSFTLTQDNVDPDAGIGDPAQYVIDKFHLPESHRIARGDNVTIAVIDSEIDANHPDLAGVVASRYDAGCGNTPPDAHGTGMTGAIASHQHLLGIAPNAKVIAICAFGGDVAGESTSIKIIKGLDYAIQKGARIVNMSFAGPRDPTLAQALQIAREKGVLLIGAAGNAGPKSPPLYPGADPNVLAVTATDDHDRLFKGANQGKYITVAAPGVDVLVPAPNEGIQITTGTSVATAHVTGVAALLLAQQPSRTPEEIRATLVQTAKHLGPKGSETQFGAGLVDPLKALRLVPPRVSQNSTATMASVR